MQIALIDYGMGNLQSVVNAFTMLGASVQSINEPSELKKFDKIILPGVGAFGEGSKRLYAAGWTTAIRTAVLESGIPFLGICLGMQLLATTGSEYGVHPGLDIIPGKVEQLSSMEKGFRLPHIGWNDVMFKKDSCLYTGLGEKKDYYFVHSYAFRPDDESVVSGVCDYFGEFAASVEWKNVFGTQYHPEKSQQAGLAVLDNFLKAKVNE